MAGCFISNFLHPEYISAVNRSLPVSIKMDVSNRLEKLFWLYWQLYRTNINKDYYRSRFGNDPEKDFGRVLNLVNFMGFVEYEDENQLKLNTGELTGSI